MVDKNKKNNGNNDENIDLDLDSEKKYEEEQSSETLDDEKKDHEVSESGVEQKDIDKNNVNQSKEEALLQEITQLRDEKLRLLADMENLRKRSEKDKIDSIRYGSMNLARDMLSPDDNITRALEAISTDEKNLNSIENLVDGLKIVQKDFSNILEKHGIKKINALNQKFDHNFHQAMVEIENDEIEEGVVIQEMQSGYTMHDRLLRPSMVGVSKKAIKKNNQEKNDEKSD